MMSDHWDWASYVWGLIHGGLLMILLSMIGRSIKAWFHRTCSKRRGEDR